MDDKPRLIEHAFPLRQASIDSVHEKNVRHGHISTLHMWPARRPLAACRAALIATLLPDPGTPEERKILLEKIGGKVINVQKKVPRIMGNLLKNMLMKQKAGSFIGDESPLQILLGSVRKSVKRTGEEHLRFSILLLVEGLFLWKRCVLDVIQQR